MRRTPRLPLRLESFEDRLTPAVAPDPSFGVAGRTFVTPGPIPQYGTVLDAAPRPDGKLWALGTIGSNPVLLRFNPNGELDRTFDGDGVLPILKWSNDVPSFSLRRIAVQADGKVVLAGSASRAERDASGNVVTEWPGYSTDLLAVRLNPDGTPDAGFGDGGRAVVAVGDAPTSRSTTLLDVRVLADGRIVLAGDRHLSPIAYADAARPAIGTGVPAVGQAFVAARLTADGRPDAGYDGDGVATVGGDQAVPGGGGSAILADGRVVFAGALETPAGPLAPAELFATAYRLAADGSPDTTFDGDGYAQTRVLAVTAPADGVARVSSSLQFAGLDPDGRLVVGVTGQSSVEAGGKYTSDHHLYAVRFATDGRPDDTFGAGGVLDAADLNGQIQGVVQVGSPSLGPVTVLPDGRLAVVVSGSFDRDGAIVAGSEVRLFTADGRPGETVFLPSGTPGEAITPSTLVPAGDSLLLGGSAPAAGGGQSRIGLIRLSDGPTGGPGAADNQNRVGRFVPARGTPRPGLDPAFAGGSVSTLATDHGPVYAYVTAAAADADGRLLVLGTVGGSPAVVRYKPDGTLDTSFDGDGVRVLPVPAGEYYSQSLTDLAVQADGKILLAGVRYAYLGGRSESRAVVRRLTADGADDAGFGDAGEAVFRPTDGSDTVAAVAQLSDGRVVVVSTGSRYESAGGRVNRSAAVGRLTADGRPDPGYGTEGVVTLGPDALRFDDVVGAAVRPDGGVTVVGLRRPNPPAPGAAAEVFAAAVRLAADGTPEAGYGRGGAAETLLLRAEAGAGGESSVSVPSSVFAMQADGAVVVGAGFVLDSGTATAARSEFRAVRFAADGSADPGFGDGGVLTLDAAEAGDGSFTTGYRSLIALPDGRLSLVSESPVLAYLAIDFAPSPPARPVVRVRRLTADGRPDPTFRPVSVPSGDSPLTVQATDPSGRVLLAGGGSGGLGVVRLAGAPDPRPVYLSAPDGTVTAYRRAADGTLAAAGTAAPFAGYAGVVRVATADVNGDGVADTVYATGDAGSRVRIEFGAAPGAAAIAPVEFSAFEAGYDGGVCLAAGDVDGDGKAEFVLAPNAGGSGRVVVFSVAAGTPVTRATFFAIGDADFRGGATCAVGDFDGDGRADLAVASAAEGSQVAVFSGATLLGTPAGVRPPTLADVEPFASAGLTLAAGDLTGDGRADLAVGGGPGGGGRVTVLDGRALAAGGLTAVANFFVAGDGTARTGVRLAVTDVTGDGTGELVAAAGHVRAYAMSAGVTNGVEPDVLAGFAAPAVGVYVG
jgi:uncharacterized delta-60 repeat protein